MQTFLCEPTFSLSVAHLDDKRLGKQRVEAYQILLALGDSWAWSVYEGNKTPDKYGWKNHPAVLMWNNYTHFLKAYMNMCILEWKERGFNNNMPIWENYPISLYVEILGNAGKGPYWINHDFITSHRCKLLQKDYEFYSKYNWIVPDNWIEIKYIWPTKKKRKNKK